MVFSIMACVVAFRLVLKIRDIYDLPSKVLAYGSSVCAHICVTIGQGCVFGAKVGNDVRNAE